MATVVLQTVGAVVGGVVGGPFGAVIGRAVGAIAGNILDQPKSAPSKDRIIEGPRLDTARLLASNEGAPIPKVYGRNRISGEIIWATQFEEVVTVTVTGGGGGGGGGRGKGGGGGGGPAPAPKTTTRTYTYFANFAVGLCEGPVSCLGRVWANGKELDLTKHEYRFYNGSEQQMPDPLIEAKQGANNTPAYRGLSYIVFDSFPLEDYGNGIPQLTFEVVRSIGALEKEIRSITVIPGSTEYGYSPQFVSSGGVTNVFRSYNRHTHIASSDWSASIDELQAICPNLETVSLVVSWFGTDLRADQCQILPGITTRSGGAWNVSGYSRSNAHLVSKVDGKVAYGGTPSDISVKAAIADLKARGLKVVLYPFIMMDVPSGNSLPDPNGGSSQPAYPWRGEITCHPASGKPGTADKTSAARTQLDTFANRATGSYRTMILHYANLCAAAGGVDGFLIGAEMRGLSHVRDDTGAFPFVETLMTLASDARQVLGQTCKITYAADWSEYFGYQPADGSNDVLYNLDPLWASTDIDAIGIDNYMPLADWRDLGDPEETGIFSTHDVEYLKSNIAGGEGYDWYYASETDRDSGTRSAITDGAGEPWIYRYKDLHSWWANEHHERHAGVRSTTATDWVPQSKPFYFTELGCPAVDKGANQPNVFYDPKSAQSDLPHFSSGGRDDLIQRRFLEAHFSYWKDAANNPVSTVYGGSMVDNSQTSLWSWDARPFPWFPMDTNTWNDGENWHRGHWLNGRLGGCSLQDLIEQVLSDHGHEPAKVKVDGALDGFVIPDALSARAALEPLLALFEVLVVEENGELLFTQQQYRSRKLLENDKLVQEGEEALKISRREAELELPAEALINHMSLFEAYRQIGTKSRRLEGGSNRQVSFTVPAVLSDPTAVQIADRQLRTAWQGRDECQISLPAEYLDITAGDIIEFAGDQKHKWLAESVETGATQELRLRVVEDFPKVSSNLSIRQHGSNGALVFGAPQANLFDLPLLRSSDAAKHLSYLAVSATPWARSYSVYSSVEEDGFSLRGGLLLQATTGELLNAVEPAPSGRWDRATRLSISLASGKLESVSETAIMNGSNIALLETTSGEYELLQFQSAKLQEDGTWELADLIRAQFGTEDEMGAGSTAGARFFLLDGGMYPLELETHEVGIELNWRVGPSRENVSSDSYTQIIHTNRARSRRMYSPVHVRASQQVDGTRFSWIRRSRIDADNWDVAEIPLDAQAERYLVRIRDDQGSLKREAEVLEPDFQYLYSAQTSDFPTPGSMLTFEVAQIGDNGLPGSFASISHTLD